MGRWWWSGRVMKKILVMICLLGGFVFGEEPEGMVRSPKEGETVEQVMVVKGRTKNVPKDHLVIVFRSTGKDNFPFPCTEPIKPNRSFSEEVHHEKTDKGKKFLQVRSMPKDIAEKIDKWRVAMLKWYERGRLGKMPSYTPGWMEATKRLVEVNYVLEGE